MEVEELATVALKGRQISVAGLETVVEAQVTSEHPVVEGVVCHVVERLQVVQFNLLNELRNESTAGRWRGDLPGLSVVVPSGGGIIEGRGSLPTVKDLLTLRVEKTIVEALSKSNSLSADGAILRRLVARGGSACLTLAEPIAESRCSLLRAVVRFTDDGRQVEVQAAQISSGHDAVGTAIQRIAGGDGSVGNLLHLARRGNVTHDVLRNDGSKVILHACHQSPYSCFDPWQPGRMNYWERLTVCC